MTLQQLQYVITLSKEKNFVSAAQKCFVTQPALTTQVKKLEDELGIIIFDRSKKPVIPTEIGQIIIEQAKTILQESKKIPDLIKEYREDLSGELRIGILPTIGLYLLPLFVNSFLNKCPSTQVHVSEHVTEDIITQLQDGNIDVGIIATPLPYGDIVAVPIYYEEMFAYISQGHPLIKKSIISTTNLHNEDLWLLSSGHCFRNQVATICRSNHKSEQERFVYESNSIEALKRIMATKQGITIIPELALEQPGKQKNNQIKKFTDIIPIREISLVVNRAYLKKKLIEKLKDEIQSALPEHMLHIGGRDIVDPF
jgi:LysR family transcriptional regulator, hydrogen peroxide-inducible genes activator